MRIRVWREAEEIDAVYLDDVTCIDILDDEFIVYNGSMFTEILPVNKPPITIPEPEKETP